MGQNRPNTRSKNKRYRPEDDSDAVSETLRKSHSTGLVTEDDMNKLYMLWKPVCQGCRVNTKDNPNCFCGLIPPLNGSRKSGLWQKISEIVQSLGPDPCKDLREPLDSPAGLTNLGATCYANSILQCLYMNKSFREGVFSVEPEVLREQPVLDQLARLFAKLHSSRMAFVDSAPFIQTLELDNGVQQDSHEFLTLLFSLLERCLSQSKVSKARTVVQDLFRGGVSHVTMCSKCGNESEASSKVEDFYELELNVKGLKSLEESLNDYLSVEELQGENQYYCESCATRVNATRSIKLRSLPAVLNFQLKRCVFLPNTTTRKKITSAFSFPGELDLAPRLSEHGQRELIYDLTAVLIHKGAAVNSGHYVAHIKYENSDLWWEFDDELVTNLGQEPFGGGSSLGARAVKTEAINVSSSEKVDMVMNGNSKIATQNQTLTSDGVKCVKTYTSNDAYMLMYVIRNSDNGGEMTNVRSVGNGMGKSICIPCPQADCALPSHLYEEVQNLNASYLESCNQYKQRKESELNLIAERRQEVRSVLSEAPVSSLGEEFFWVSIDWLRQWADNVTPPNIDNTSIQCVHGKVPVSKVSSMKRLSPVAWATLSSKYNGGPTLGKHDFCTDCVLEMAHSLTQADSYRDQRSLMKEIAEAALAGECLDGRLYYISKSWLQQWLRRKNTDFPCEADAGPTASIRCPHGELMPEKAAGSRRLMIPESLWQFIRENAVAARPNDTIGCSAFVSDSVPCVQCSSDLTEVASLEDTLREFKLKQRQGHERLAGGKGLTLDPHTRYYLLPFSWYSKWKSFINSTGKNSTEPETLVNVIDSMICKKHFKLLERPPELIWRRGQILLKAPSTDALVIISENDWKLFCEDWGGVQAKGISAEIQLFLEDCSMGSSEGMPISEEHMSVHNDSKSAIESRKPVISTSPEVCEDCIGERDSCELMRKLNYSNEDICVCLVRGREPPKSILEASGNTLDPNRRASKRSRKAAFGNSVNLNVSGSTTVYQLRMMIWESLGVVKENQILHKGSSVIDGESACLADLNIFPGDVLWVTDSEIHENRDIADELFDQKLEVQNSEEGFRGTLLASSISCRAGSEACLK